VIKLHVGLPLGMGLVYTKKRMRKLMRQAGQEVAGLARALIRRAAGGGRTYGGSGGSKFVYKRSGKSVSRPYKAGAYTASAPGQPPVNVTGTLLRGIIVRPFKSGDGVAVRDRTFYALFLEAGARGGGRKKRGGQRVKGKAGAASARVLQPRPFLSTALARRERSLGERVRAAIIDDIEFRRIKP